MPSKVSDNVTGGCSVALYALVEGEDVSVVRILGLVTIFSFAMMDNSIQKEEFVAMVVTAKVVPVLGRRPKRPIKDCDSVSLSTFQWKFAVQLGRLLIIKPSCDLSVDEMDLPSPNANTLGVSSQVPGLVDYFQ